MGFFNELKEDLAQAMNELLPDDEKEDDALKKHKEASMLDQNSTESGGEKDDKLIELPEYAEINVHTVNDKNDEADKEFSFINEPTKNMGVETMDDNIDLELLEALNSGNEQKSAESNSETNDVLKTDEHVRALSIANEEEVTVITKGTTINGSISTDGSLDIKGTVNGDIQCLGKLSITGNVKGNSSAAEVYISTERYEGNIISEGSVKIALGTVVIGDINARSGVFAGAVKGEIDINGPVVIDSTAVIKGNIKAKSVQVNNGAVLEGFCSLSYADIDVDNIFE